MLPGLLLMLLAFTTYNNACVYTARYCINYLEIIAPIYGLPRPSSYVFAVPWPSSKFLLFPHSPLITINAYTASYCSVKIAIITKYGLLRPSTQLSLSCVQPL